MGPTSLWPVTGAPSVPNSVGKPALETVLGRSPLGMGTSAGCGLKDRSLEEELASPMVDGGERIPAPFFT